jgi:uncharacterized protein (DUF169 family)
MKRLSQILTEALALRLPPVAVTLSDVAPSNVPRYAGRVPAGCKFWEDATRGAFYTEPEDHEACAIGTFTHNLPSPSTGHDDDRRVALRVFAELGYVRSEDLALIPQLTRSARYVLYAPLADAPLAPDVVLLFVDAAQSLIVAEGAQQIEGSLAPALGRPACAVVPQAINTGRAALSLGCCGARAYLDALDDATALWALPGTQLAAYVDRIAALAHANRILTRFHVQRKADISRGERPTVEQSLSRLSDAS